MPKSTLPLNPRRDRPTERVRLRDSNSLKAKKAGRELLRQPPGRSDAAEIPDESDLREDGGVLQALKTARTTMERASGLEMRYRGTQRIGVAQCYAAARALLEDDEVLSGFAPASIA